MPLLKDQDKREIRKRLADLERPVTLVMFTQEHECSHCTTTRELVEEVASLSDKITAEIRDFVADAGIAQEYGVDKIPAIVVRGERDYGIRFFGIPAGYEFAAFLEAIRDVGRGDPQLSPDWLKLLEKVDQPVHIQVLVTPTCPYCSGAVRAAHRFAMASEHITGSMVEVSEFPQLAVRYQVQGVPKTVINETHSFVGAMPEMKVAQEILRAIGK